MSAYDEVMRMLEADGAYLRKGRKHNVYILSNGKRFVTAASPSDVRSWDNNLSDLKHAMGIVKTETTAPRRTKQEARDAKQQEARRLREQWQAARNKEAGNTQAFAATPQQEIVPPTVGRYFTSGALTPIGIKRRSNRTSGTPHGDIVVYSREVIAKYNDMARYDEAAAKRFLEEVRSGSTGVEHEEEVNMNTNTNSKSTWTAMLAEVDAKIAALADYRNSLAAVASKFGAVSGIMAVPVNMATATTTVRGPKRGRAPGSKTFFGVPDHVARILAEEGRPMGFGEIWEAITRMTGYEDYKKANIYPLILKDKRFAKTEHGSVKLATWATQGQAVSAN